MNYQISRTKEGKPFIGVGGGKLTNTFAGRTVLDKYGDLKEPFFIRVTGHRANRDDQAFVIIEPGDIIVQMHGNFPINDSNPEAHMDAQEILSINDQTDTAITQAYPIMYDEIPESVIEGLTIRHNREGKYFCKTGGV